MDKIKCRAYLVSVKGDVDRFFIESPRTRYVILMSLVNINTLVKREIVWHLQGCPKATWAIMKGNKSVLIDVKTDEFLLTLEQIKYLYTISMALYTRPIHKVLEDF